jgi:hypothetical protein
MVKMTARGVYHYNNLHELKIQGNYQHAHLEARKPRRQKENSMPFFI